MPHVVIFGPLTPERVHRELRAFDERDAVAIYRVRESFLARAAGLALLEIVVIEGTPRRLFLAIEGRSQADGGITVHIHALTDVEKTPGVKRAIARVARRILVLDPAARIGPTNLERELRDIESEGAVGSCS